MKKIIFTIGALLLALGLAFTVYQVKQEKLPQFELKEDKIRPSDLLSDLLEKANKYNDYILASDYLSITLNGDGRIGLHSVQNEGETRFSISHHFYELTAEEELLIGTYEKVEDGSIFDHIEGGFFKDRDGLAHFFEYRAMADEDRLPLHVQAYDEQALAEADFRDEVLTEAELEEALGVSFSDVKVLDQEKIDLTAYMMTVETGLMETVNVYYKGEYQGEKVMISVQAMPGEMKFDDHFEKIKNVYVQDQLDQAVYYWLEDGIVYNLQMGQLDDLFTHQEIVALIQYMTEPIR